MDRQESYSTNLAEICHLGGALVVVRRGAQGKLACQDPNQRLPRELLTKLIEEGSEAFRDVLEKLLNAAIQME